MRTLMHLARIRRVEFLVVEVTILFLPLLITIDSFAQLSTWAFAEAVLLFFALYTVGDVVNCLADRDLDSSYKSHLSEAVYGLGVPVVRGIVLAFSALSLALAAHLTAATGKWGIAALAVLGLVLGLGYSLQPLFFKGRGVLHLVCLWLLLYFIPMLYSGLLLLDTLPFELIALAAAYATVEMGIILINTSEDYPEDMAEGVVTTTVALGLPRTLTLAFLMTAFGGTGFFGLFAALFLRYEVPRTGFLALAAGICVLLWVVWELWKLATASRHASLDASVLQVKSKGKLVPVWATAIGWAGMVCGLVLVGVR